MKKMNIEREKMKQKEEVMRFKEEKYKEFREIKTPNLSIALKMAK